MFPLVYELNSRCWLRELSARHGYPVTLANVPETEVASWKRFGFTHVWLMGVWTVGPRARAEALADNGVRRACQEALPDCHEEDIGASPYAIADYQVAASLGGEPGLHQFRARLNRAGMKLILDFVPNHLGLDHPWIQERPSLFVQGTQPGPGTFSITSGTTRIAHGRDPHFGAWTDTAQLDYRRLETRIAMEGLLRAIAHVCDGVRCDMAMLLLNDVFSRTWAEFPVVETQVGNSGAGSEFWDAAIASVKREFPDFLFLAEVYWDFEPRLQDLGFDYTYDKVFYDRLTARDLPGLRAHLLQTPPVRAGHNCLFLENHDEPRAAARLQADFHFPAACLMLALPGMRLLHEGQLDGARTKVPVQLLRRPPQPTGTREQAFYARLLAALESSLVGRGSPETAQRIVNANPRVFPNGVFMVSWRGSNGGFEIVAVNLAPTPIRCQGEFASATGESQSWSVREVLQSDAPLASSVTQWKDFWFDLTGYEVRWLRFEPA